MRSPHLPRVSLGALLLLAPLAGLSAQQATSAAGTRQFTSADLKAWRTIRNPTLSGDGRWFAYVLAPNEGDASVVIRPTAESTKEWRFAIGSVPGPGGGPGGGAG